MLKEVGLLFPGQGAQAVGMGHDFYQASPETRAVFDKADQWLGFPLTQLCFQGPDAELTRTVNAQIAIFVTSLALLAYVRAKFPNIKPVLACGLSLGEFTALVALEAISFEDGLKLVKHRGEAMEEAAQRNPGTMATILGLSVEDCLTICNETGAKLANLNSANQLVISGSGEHISKASELARSKGAKRVIALKVGGAFHSPLMEPARTHLEAALKTVKINRPKGVFIPNVTAQPEANPKAIEKLLSQQLTSPVQWIKTMEYIGQNGPKDYLEIGPGKVLKGLARQNNPELNVVSVEKISDVEQLNQAAVN